MRPFSADQRFPRGRVDEEILGVKAQLVVVAAELRYECRADSGRAAVDRAVELVVDRVLSHEGHDAVQILTVESLGEPRHQIGELVSLHRSSPSSFLARTGMTKLHGQTCRFLHGGPPTLRHCDSNIWHFACSFSSLRRR